MLARWALESMLFMPGLFWVDPRVINVEFGWWFPERHDGECGAWDSNANVLTNIEPPYDPAIGTYQLRALLCWIGKVKVAL